MAKTNYTFEKRQKEIAKKQKKEEKRQKKIAPQGEQPQSDQAQLPADGVPSAWFLIRHLRQEFWNLAG